MPDSNTANETIANQVMAVFDATPAIARQKLLEARHLILKLAKQHSCGAVEETLKWGEPAYLVKGGSTIRIAWKEKAPSQYGIYFNCNTKLVDTFREIYPDTFKYEGNRAIILPVSRNPPVAELSHCLTMALQYKKVKDLPLLGA